MCNTRGGKIVVFRGRPAWKKYNVSPDGQLRSIYFPEKRGLEAGFVLYSDKELTREYLEKESREYRRQARRHSYPRWSEFPGIYACEYSTSSLLPEQVIVKLALFGPGQVQGDNLRADTAVVMEVYAYSKTPSVEALRRRLASAGIPVTLGGTNV